MTDAPPRYTRPTPVLDADKRTFTLFVRLLQQQNRVAAQKLLDHIATLPQ